MAEWLCSGLQSRGRRFDSDPSLHKFAFARVAEQVDARDLKSLEGNLVPVRFRPRAPINKVNMFRPVSLFIGLRYTRAKRRNHFISFISLVSMLGIALGVAVLITVLSVMNGFDYEIRHRIFDVANQVSVTNYIGAISEWPAVNKKITQNPNVIAASPFVSGQGMILRGSVANPVLVTGIVPNKEATVSNMQANLVAGSFDLLKPKKFNVIIGQSLAASLGVGVGDKIILLIPQASASPMGVMPRSRQFNIVGIFHVEGNFNYDRGMIYTHMQDAQALYQLQNNITGFRLKVNDLYAAPAIAQALQQTLGDSYYVSDWTEEWGPFFKMVRMEKTTMFIILLLIIVVAAFNLVSSLVMVVTDKRAEIAILRTLGATPRTIMSTFIVQGFVVSLIGVLFGILGGILLALNATNIVTSIQHLFHVDFVASVFYIDYLPSRLVWSDVWQISLIAVFLSLFATLYPAWQASRVQPAEALRYE